MSVSFFAVQCCLVGTLATAPLITVTVVCIYISDALSKLTPQNSRFVVGSASVVKVFVITGVTTPMVIYHRSGLCSPATGEVAGAICRHNVGHDVQLLGP